MLTTQQKIWALNQAIAIVQQAPGDSLPVPERLKRTYKRLLALAEHAHEEERSAPPAGASAKRPTTKS